MMEGGSRVAGILVRATIALGALCACAGGGAAQSIGGRVVLAGWEEPVDSASVQLLGEGLGALDSVLADADGRFSFPDLPPGRYHLQARLGGTSSGVAGPVDLDNGDGPRDLVLALPSPLFDRARACLPGYETDTAVASGVLAGLALDAATTTPLPGARIRVAWPGVEAAGGLEAGADAGGRFVFCRVPADVPLTVRAEVLGRLGKPQEGILVKPGALARLDVTLELGGSSLRVLDSWEEVRTDSSSTVHGRLLDAELDAPISGAVVRVGDREDVTDTDGRFRFSGLRPGLHAFHVVRLGYDWASKPVQLAAGATVVLELRAAPEALALDAVVVRATTVESRMARASTQAPRVIAGARLHLAELRAASIMEVLREFPNLEIDQGRFETADGIEYGVCIESSRALPRYAVPEKQTNLPWCEMIAIVIDGVPTVRATELVHGLRLREIESIEFLPPTGALRWGQRAAVTGAIVIWTRGRGPHREQERDGRGG